MNRHAHLLGKMAKGKKKRLTPEELQRRIDRLAEARKKRWGKHDNDNPESD